MKVLLGIKAVFLAIILKLYPIYKICLICFAMAFITIETTEIQTPDVMAIIHEILINLDPIAVFKNGHNLDPDNFVDSFKKR